MSVGFIVAAIRHLHIALVALVNDAYHGFVKDPFGPGDHIVDHPSASFNLFDE